MATKVSPEADEIVSEIHIAAPPERVFEALVDPKQVVQWWGQQGIYRSTEFTADLRVGGKWRIGGDGPDGGKFEVVGEYVEIERPHLIVYTWVATWTGAAKTTVRWELTRDDKGTLAKIRHSGLSAYPEIAQSYRGWPRMLGWLQAFLQTGETVESRKPPTP
ncbi:MAG TPA: SRPBCC domain-containing protein [Candidatus Acidoferrales bacterium]|nr:SRPBCC domain-containing protein [Candidatus Acidoferrales bacterium]